ncbi:MAG: hypothetical protein CMD58_01320 [Gammaproteobacteria bacterium]|nr:hypothetical protein [Gammaproteobacteria bacterium]
MDFITLVTISIVIYFIARFSYRKDMSLYYSIIISAVMFLFLYFMVLGVTEVLSAFHFIATGFTMLFLFISYNEIIILERKIRQIKKGKLINLESFSIEKNYRIVLKLLGTGLVFLSLVLITGLSMDSIFTANLIFKSIFTFIAWLIFLIILIGIRYFNFSIKYATRSLFMAMLAVLTAYFLNEYLVNFN